MVKKFFGVLEKLLLPAALGLLGFLTTQAANKISEGQLRLAESTARDRQEEFQKTIQAKYVEIFYSELNSGDPKKQRNAIRLLKLMDNRLATDLAGLTEATPGVSGEVKAGAERIRKEIEAFGPLSGYKIGIYFLQGKDSLASKANDIQRKLTQRGFKGKIQLYPKDKSFLESVGEPTAHEVRYEPGIEDGAADTLLTILKEIYPALSFMKREVGGRTADFISIFIPPDG